MARGAERNEYGILESLPGPSLVLDLSAVKVRLEGLPLSEHSALLGWIKDHRDEATALAGLVQIRGANASARKLFGISALLDPDHNAWSLYTPDSLPVILRALQRLFLGEGVIEESVRLNTSDGESGAWDLRLAPGAEGDWSEVLASFRPRPRILAGTGLETIIGDDRLFDTMDLGFALHEMIFDAGGKPVDYRFLSVNGAFERLTGLRREAILGHRVLEVLPDTEARWIETYGAVALSGKPMTIADYSASLDRHFEVWAWRPAPGHFAVLVQDATGRIRGELALAENERRLAETGARLDSALEATGAGLWDWDIATGLTTIDARWERMLGYEPGERVLDAERWRDLCHPEDLSRSDEQMRIHLAGESPRYECEIRLRKKDGSWLWIVDRGRVSARDESGTALRVTGTQVDITRRKEAELAENREYGIITSLLDSIQDLIFWKDPAGAFMGCNHAVERLLGRGERDIIGRKGAELLPEAYAREDREEDRVVLEHGIPLRSEGWLVTADGGRRYMERMKSPLRMRNGDIVGVAGVARDVTERRNAEAIVAARYRILEYARGHSSEELMTKALDVAEELTDSVVGFFLALDPDRETWSLNAWSTRTRERYCRIEQTERHFPLAEAGVWIECVRERRAIIHNDYASLENRKGLPSGHLPLVRELIVPIIREDRVVGVFAVGNKPDVYDAVDVLSVSQLADQLWDVARSRIADEQLRKTLAEKEALLRELFHRTKNSMQLINAMLELKKQELGDGAHVRTFEDIQNKILAMALVQENIYRSGNLSSIDLGSYVRELASVLEDAALMKPTGVSVSVSATEVKVSVDSAIPCGIVVSELLTNSFIHAYPTGLKGHIDIEVGGEEDGDIWIEARDDGIGLPAGLDPRHSPHLGLQTVVGIGEEQLRGSVSFGKEARGFSCRVTFRDLYRDRRIP